MSLEELVVENERLRQLILQGEFLWGGFCPWCGCHRRHDGYPDNPCPAFSGIHEVRVGAPPKANPKPYEVRHQSR